MPELPEVETIKLGLQKKLIGLTIKQVQVLNPKTFLDINGKPFDYAQDLQGKKVLKVWRRAKILGIDLGMSNAGPASSQTLNLPTSPPAGGLGPHSGAPRSLPPALTLLFHLKMTGQLIWVGNPSTSLRTGRLIGGHPTLDTRDALPNKSTRVIFEFSDRSKLYFNDQRKFGWIKVMDNGQLTMDNLLNNLGPEPLVKGFTWQVLKTNLLKHKNLPVKAALMDQQVIAGVGNIYANETCFDAKIDPRAKVSGLIDTHFRALHRGVIKSLKDAIKHGGSTIAHFVDSEGHKGYFIDYAYVYGRDGEKCKKCGSIIQKLQLGGRGTYFCKKCQKS